LHVRFGNCKSQIALRGGTTPDFSEEITFVEQFASPTVPISSPPPAMPVAHLTVRTADGEQRVVPLGPDPITIGRADTNAVVIKDDWVSRQHIEISLGPDGRYYARDLGSRNGMFVNGHSAQFVPLNPNDSVQLGQNQLIFSSGGSLPGGTALAIETSLARADLIGVGEDDAANEGGKEGEGSGSNTDDDTGGLSGTIMLYGRAEATIGRTVNNDLVLDHIQVSRHHARARWDEWHVSQWRAHSRSAAG